MMNSTKAPRPTGQSAPRDLRWRRQHAAKCACVRSVQPPGIGRPHGRRSMTASGNTVSYTHLTLPTICSV
eukprot:3559479-Alexandrium_andersonii.AAC.1